VSVLADGAIQDLEVYLDDDVSMSALHGNGFITLCSTPADEVCGVHHHMKLY